jgi:Meiotically Up-regulated Gene 113 (MUG113) protein
MSEKEPCCCLDVRGKHRHDFVYVLAFDGNVVKIGRSADPGTRTAQIISSSSLEVSEVFLFAVLDSVKAEANLLKWYRNFALNGGEWFVIPEDIRRELHTGPEKPKLVINGIAYWSHCGRMPECTLCNLLNDLEKPETLEKVR